MATTLTAAMPPTKTKPLRVLRTNDHEDVRPVRKPRPKRYKIQEVIKVRQILFLIQVQEERGKTAQGCGAGDLSVTGGSLLRADANTTWRRHFTQRLPLRRIAAKRLQMK
jgi:hypothetical protein